MCGPELEPFFNKTKAALAKRDAMYPRAEILLAKEIREGLVAEVDPSRLRDFIRARWSRVETLAHAIHRG